VGARADRVIDRIRTADGGRAALSSGHFLRVLGARWLGLPTRRRPHFMACERRA
jgi:probable phosphoglycerate mutase